MTGTLMGAVLYKLPFHFRSLNIEKLQGFIWPCGCHHDAELLGLLSAACPACYVDSSTP